jgi:cytochrome c biogenesis protein CcdA/thiol-disulfide isomerase/thioredoxin
MALLAAFAFVSGVITILSPCILPVLPIVLSGAVGGGRRRPLGVVTGFVLSFALFTLALTAIVRASGVSPDVLRAVAFVAVIAFGLVLLVPPLQAAYERLLARIPALARAGGGRASAGFAGGLAIGASLGIVWTPCVGPIMASVVGLALTQELDGGAVVLTVAYALGTAVPMLAVMIGGRALIARVPALARNSTSIQRAFGALMIVVGVSIGLGWDRGFQAWVLRVLPGYGVGLTSIENAAPVRRALDLRNAGDPMMAPGVTARLDPPAGKAGLGDYGAAPALVARGRWFQTVGVAALGGAPREPGTGPAGRDVAEAPALTMAALRGKVVLIDFWTYSCVNCVRTLPYVRAWWDAYRDNGLVVIGVHTPEFEFEKSAANVERALADLGVTWPVVQDNDYAQWKAYANRYWPAKYLVDAAGRIRYFHFGEGEYAATEAAIRALLVEAGTLGPTAADRAVTAAKQDAVVAGLTPETYLGYDRADRFGRGGDVARDRPVKYEPTGRPAQGEWNLRGVWTVAREHVVPEAEGTLELGFRARRVYLVVEPVDTDAKVDVRVDGRPAGDTADVHAGTFSPSESRLYEVVALPRVGEHTLTLHVKGRLRLFALTFG